jgi:hypothetical protein
MELPGQYLKYFADEKMRAKGDALSFDFDRDPATLARARRIYDANGLTQRNAWLPLRSGRDGSRWRVAA